MERESTEIADIPNSEGNGRHLRPIDGKLVLRQQVAAEGNVRASRHVLTLVMRPDQASPIVTPAEDNA